jgi:carboxyl-terminal processing protease
MRRFSQHWLVAFAVALILAGGAATGALFGERSIPEGEQELVLRASRIVSLLIDWLPEEKSPEDIVYDGIDGMLEVLDPHSSFLDPRTYRTMRARQEGSFFGVGIIISMREGKVTVIAPMAGTPAAQKGLRAGDVISAVEAELTEELTLDEVVDRVRGPEGTSVRLTIDRPGLNDTFDVEITRARIPTNSVRYAFMVAPDTGYIRLSEFNNTSTREVSDAIESLSAQGMKRLVLDLRNNPGGTLDAAIGVSDVFLRPGQLIVTTRGRTADSVSTLSAPGHGAHFEGPLVILVNEGSASASEIVAGAVQDHDRGLVLGQTTWGKGLVQTMFSVRDTGLALTTARYYTPSGRCIQRDYGSYIDYITHKNGGSDSTNTTARFETDIGRAVRDGGGVTPDVEVELRELSEPVVRLYGASAFFRFAVEILKDIPEPQHNAFAQSFELTPRVLESLWTWIKDREILDDDAINELKADEQATTDIARAIRIELLNATVGLEQGYREAIQADEQFRAALEYLPEAQQMWLRWEEKGS